MKLIERSCLLLAAATMTGALWLGSLSASAHAASPTAAAPSADAIAACQGKKEGDTVKLDLPKGKSAKAVCRKMQGKLVALRTASIGP